MGVCTLHDVLNRVGPFKLIRGDPGRPDGWIQPDSVVDEEEDVLNLNKKEVASVHKSEELLLFHLDEDPYEKINLATKFPAVTKYLSKLLDKYEVIFLFTNQNCSLLRQEWLLRILLADLRRATLPILAAYGAQDGAILQTKLFPNVTLILLLLLRKTFSRRWTFCC